MTTGPTQRVEAGTMPPQGLFAHVNQTPVMREASLSTTGPTERAEAGIKPPQRTFTPVTHTPVMREVNLSTTGPTPSDAGGEPLDHRSDPAARGGHNAAAKTLQLSHLIFRTHLYSSAEGPPMPRSHHPETTARRHKTQAAGAA